LNGINTGINFVNACDNALINESL